MFTVKLYKGHSIRLIQTSQIDVHPAGPLSAMAADPKDRTNDVRELDCKDGDSNQVFMIAGSREPGLKQTLRGFPVFDMAYIENEAGATTQVVRPY